MKLQTFNNLTGLIHGKDNKRITCDKEGVLKIGATEISISPDIDAVMPVLFNGWTGKSAATFTDKLGKVYDLGQVAFKAGRIVNPGPEAVELADLRARQDLMEKEISSLREEVQELRNIFDTDSLNFLIK